MNDELSALVFELQRAPSPAEKAKVLARAWRTVRALDPVERRLLARDVGFDGAEELIEGLGGKERGVFAPAAVLEALGKLRADPDLSVRRILADLRDPVRRDDLLVRGMDLVAESVAPKPEPDLGVGRFELPDGDVWMMGEDASESHDRALEFENKRAETAVEETVETRRRVRAVPPVPGQEQRPEPQPQPEPRPKPKPRARPKPQARLESKPEAKPMPESTPKPEGYPVAQPNPVPEPPTEPEQPSPWDTFSAHEGRVVSTSPATGASLIEIVPSGRSHVADEEAEGSVIERLRALREKISGLGSASVSELAERLDAFHEPWARRRALVALIGAHVPDRAAAALDLIEDLERPMDRSWCLSALARRGDLAGDDLERALAMLVSPATKRRVAALAAG